MTIAPIHSDMGLVQHLQAEAGPGPCRCVYEQIVGFEGLSWFHFVIDLSPFTRRTAVYCCAVPDGLSGVPRAQKLYIGC